MKRIHAPTLKDVAREAGVAVMTVSVVLNGARSATRVSDATRLRIEEAAKRLHYRPNAVGRGLSRRRMDTLGVVAMIDGPLNFYFLEALNGILSEAASRGQNTTVLSVSDWALDEEKILQFCDGRVDGIVLVAPSLTPEFYGLLSKRTPFAAMHGAAGVHNMEVDNENGAFEIVSYLIGLGHRRVAHFTGSLEQSGARLRFAGYRRALEAGGLSLDESLVYPGAFTIESGRERMAALLGSEAPPSAVFCANDAVAYGAMETMSARGLKAPEDFSIAGFDDLALAMMTTPHLTTMRQPFREMAARAVEMVLQQVGDSVAGSAVTPGPPPGDLFPVQLIVRESAGPPRDGDEEEHRGSIEGEFE